MYELCANQGFLDGTSDAPHEVFATNRYGWGVRATACLLPQAFVLEYVGEVVGRREFERRFAVVTQARGHYYFMALQRDLIIDAQFFGNNARFINHSCQPNCVAEVWQKNGIQRVAIVAVKAIEPLEEITFNYRWSPSFQEFTCLSASPKCRHAGLGC
ncbi:hypothetical protein AaE_014258 [Aphanomyces astaci]|uniref:SET domain-containing protein n=1 Tax=Aphanomyces astaci TaxID=112090 RepID=A0A6A4Z7S8_APHAT|nr:hypothetical protein AaE_014258 [Aphanomyces astaci]